MIPRNRPLTVNEILQDRAIRHALYLQRLKSAEANRILAFLARDVFADVRRIIKARVLRMERLGTDTGPVTTARIREIEQSIQAVTDALDLVRTKMLEPQLQDIAHSEAAWQTKIIRSASPVRLDLVTPSPSMLSAIVSARPFQGRLLRDWWSDLDRGLRAGVTREIGVGVALGKTNAQIVSRLLSADGGALAISHRNAMAIVQTSVAHVSTHARQASFEANSDVIKKVQWVATLDERTCLRCMPLDGKTYPIDSGPRPPLHFNCRCTTSPVLKSWKELGINLKEAPPGTRSSMNGQVPSSTTYEQWIGRQSEAIQNEALGPTRAQLFRDGKVTIGDFTDNHQNVLTLPQLQAREGLTAEDLNAWRN